MENKNYYQKLKQTSYDPINIEKDKEYFDICINTFIAGLIRDNALTTVSNPTNYDVIDNELCKIYNSRTGNNLTKEEFSVKRQSKEIPTYASWSFEFGSDGYINKAYVIYGFKMKNF